MTEFNVGDRVVLGPAAWCGTLAGKVGTLVQFDPEDTRIPWKVLIDGDTYFPRGRWVRRGSFRPVPSVLSAAQAAVEAATPESVAEEGDVRSQVLAEASRLINGDREKEYGTPQVNFRRIASLWDVLVPRPEPWTPAQVALAMVGVKLGRAVQGYKRDTAVDLGGYAALWALLSEDAA